MSKDASQESPDALSIWVIYDHPRDRPDLFVARRHEIADGASAPTDDHYAHKDLEMLRWQIQEENPGCICIPRDPNDDPVIIETWL